MCDLTGLLVDDRGSNKHAKRILSLLDYSMRRCMIADVPVGGRFSQRWRGFQRSHVRDRYLWLLLNFELRHHIYLDSEGV